MSNQFDFYTIQGRSTRKKDLLAVTSADGIRSCVDYSGRWPRRYYEATISFVEAYSPDSVDLLVAKYQAMTAAKIFSKYHCRD